jgi:dCMP deaminase
MKSDSCRLSKDEYYLNIAFEIAKRGTCLRRNFGTVIVNNDQIISTGYTGSPRGCKNCCDTGKCLRDELNIPKGERYELCASSHSEANAIIHASRRDMIGSILYVSGFETKTGYRLVELEPCKLCKKMIINAGIDKVIVNDKNNIKVFKVKNWVKDNSWLIQGGY